MNKFKYLIIIISMAFCGFILNFNKVGAQEVSYSLDVKSGGVVLRVNGENKTSDENGLITFVVDDENLADIVISSDLLKETTYSLSDSLTSELLVPSSVILNDNNVLSSDSSNLWSVKAKVTFFGGSEEEITLVLDLSEDNLSSYEMVFNDVSLSHDKYVISDTVDLSRTTSVLENYVEVYASLNEASSDFKVKLDEVKSSYEAMSLTYASGNVSEETLTYYNNYLSNNEIGEDSFALWEDSIVTSVVLKNESISVVYGDTVEEIVIVTYLNEREEEKTLVFDYLLEDINESSVLLTSTNKVTSSKGTKVVYDEYVSVSASIIKRKVYSEVSEYSFTYDGNEKELDISFNNISDKFNDLVSDVVVKYNDSEARPVDAGNYTVDVSFNVTNSDYYDFSEFSVNDLVINAKVVTLVWLEPYSIDYDGRDKLDVLTPYYEDVNLEKVYAFVNQFEVKDAGDYNLSASISDDNYVISEESKSRSYTINKIDLNVSVSDYSINYSEYIPYIEVDKVGQAFGDYVDVIYKIVRNDVSYGDFDVLGQGEYEIVIEIRNIEELENNYNIHVSNGKLTVIGDETVISVANNSYNYKGSNFIYSFVDAEVRGESSELVSNPEFEYSFKKNDEVINEAIDIGEYEVTITYLGNERYSSSSLTFNLTILTHEVSIAIDNKESVYGEDLAELTYKISEGEIYNPESMNITLSKEEGNDVNEYVISGVYNNSNITVNFTTGVYKILKREIEVTIDDKESYYLENLAELTYSVTSETKIIEGDNLNIILSKSKENNKNVDSYVIEGSYSNDNYIVSFVKGTYTIKAININNIGFNDVTTKYNGRAVSFGVNNVILSDRSVAQVKYYIYDEEANDYVLYENPIVNVGVYNVLAVISSSNYNTLELSSTITINKGETLIGYNVDMCENNKCEKYYDGEAYDYTLNNDKLIFEDYKGLENEARASVTYRVIKKVNETEEAIVSEVKDAGVYEIQVKIVDPRGYYEDKVSIMNFEVLPYKVIATYSLNQDGYVYNGESQTPGAGAIIDVFLTYSTKDGETLDEAPSNVGEYIAIINVNVEDSNNYVIINPYMDFKIIPLEVEVKDFVDTELVYNGEEQLDSVLISNIKGEDDVRVVLEKEAIVNVGEYEVVIKGIEGNSSSNYSISNLIDEKIIVKVNKKDIVVMPEETSKVYGEDDKDIAYSLSEELYNGDEIVGNLTREEGEDVGEYLILKGTLDAGNNYNFIVEEAKFIITCKVVSISYIHPNFVYNGHEQKLMVSLSEGAHLEYEGDLISAGEYTVKVVLDSDNYCLPEGYQDIKVRIARKDISSNVTLNQYEYDYNGEKVEASVNALEYDYVVYYYVGGVRVDEVNKPGKYIARVIVDNNNVYADTNLEFTVLKGKFNKREVSIVTHYNKIVVEKADDLEYKINNGDYFSNNEFGWLNELTEYTISVRVKENDWCYASDAVTYIVKTTRDPIKVNALIDTLGDRLNEESFKTIKEINKYMKDTNELDVDSEKLAKYKVLKEKYDSSTQNIEVDIENVNKISKFIESSILFVGAVMSILVTLFVVKRKLI